MTRRVHWGVMLGLAAAAVGVGLVAGAVRVGSRPAGDVPVVCVMAAAADNGVPMPAPHAWERKCS